MKHGIYRVLALETRKLTCLARLTQIIVALFLLMLLCSSPQWVDALPPAMMELDGKIAYTDEDADGHYQIFVLDLATRTTTQLTHSVDGDNYSPRWSPDNQRIAYIFSPDTWDDDYRWAPQTLMVINADGTSIVAVHDATIRSPLFQVNLWSPDNQYMTIWGYDEQRPGEPPPNIEIYVADADGRNLRRIPINVLASQAVALGWSANNDILLGQRDSGVIQISPSGIWKKTKTLVDSPDFFGINPEGNLLVYEVEDTQQGESQRWLWTLDLTTMTRRQIAPLPSADFAYLARLLWTVNRDYLVLPLPVPDYNNVPIGQSATVWVLEVATGIWQEVTDANWFYYDCSPAESQLVYSYYDFDGDVEVRVLDLGTGDTLTLTTGEQPNWSN